MIQPETASRSQSSAADTKGQTALADNQLGSDILEAGIAVTIFSLLLGISIWLVQPATQIRNLQPWLLPAMVLPAIPVSAILSSIAVTAIQKIDALLSRRRAARTTEPNNSKYP